MNFLQKAVKGEKQQGHNKGCKNNKTSKRLKGLLDKETNYPSSHSFSCLSKQ